MNGNEIQEQVEPSNMDYNPFGDDVIVSSYTDAQAIKDGVLFDLGEVDPDWKHGLINIISTNLLFSKGYAEKVVRTPRLKKGDINIPNLLDLLNISAHALNPRVQRDIIKNGGQPDRLYTGIMIEGPDGEMFEAWAGRNETFFTLMLKEDY
jgi:hypothetical protein